MKFSDISLALLVCLIWAGNQVMSRIVVADLGVPPICYALVRSLIIAAVLLPLLRPLPQKLGVVIVAGILLGGGGFAFNFIGLQLASPSTAAVVLQLSVPMATILSLLVLGELISWRRATGISLAFFGVLVLLWDPNAMQMSFGLLFSAGSAFCSALGAVLLKKIGTVHPLRIQAWGSLSSIPLLLAASLSLEKTPVAAAFNGGWAFVAAVTASALIVSIFSHSAYYGLVQKYEANQVVSLMLVHSLMTILLGIWITGDHMTWRMVIGGAFTLIGVYIVAVRSGRRPIDPTDPLAIAEQVS